MKKTFCLAFTVVAIIFASVELRAQKLDAVVENGIGNIGQENELNFRNLGLDVCLISFGDSTNNLFGFFVETGEVYSKEEETLFTSRFTEWSTGLSFNAKLGQAKNWHLKLRAGVGGTTTRGKVGIDYNDKQTDKTMVALVNVFNYRTGKTLLSRTAFEASYRHPMEAEKQAYWQNKLITEPIPVWDNQLLRAKLIVTPLAFFVDKEQDWKINFDLIGGYGMEHRLIDGKEKMLNYATVSGGISFFKVPYFYQNILSINAEMQFMETQRFIVSAKVNLVPVIFLIWEKAEIAVNLSSKEGKK